jgi:hypothetical protein
MISTVSQLFSAGEQVHEFDTSEFSAGMYYVKAIVNNNVYFKKIIKLD